MKKKMIIAALVGIAFVILLGGLLHVENERYNNGNCYICGYKYNVEIETAHNPINFS